MSWSFSERAPPARRELAAIHRAVVTGPRCSCPTPRTCCRGDRPCALHGVGNRRSVFGGRVELVALLFSIPMINGSIRARCGDWTVSYIQHFRLLGEEEKLSPADISTTPPLTHCAAQRCAALDHSSVPFSITAWYNHPALDPASFTQHPSSPVSAKLGVGVVAVRDHQLPRQARADALTRWLSLAGSPRSRRRRPCRRRHHRRAHRRRSRCRCSTARCPRRAPTASTTR